MNIVCVYHPENGSFEVYGHDLDESQTAALGKKLRSRGVGSDIIPQNKPHKSILDSCNFCQAEVEAYYLKQRQVDILSRPPEQPLSLGQGGISKQLEATGILDLHQDRLHQFKRATPYLAGIVILVLALALIANPAIQKVIPAMQALLQQNPKTTEPAFAAQTTSSFFLLAESSPEVTQPADLAKTAAPVIANTSTSRPVTTATSLIATATLIAPTATSTLSPSPTVLNGCKPVADILLADVGQEVCITGTAARTSDQKGIFYIFFDDQISSFYLVSYEGAGGKIQPGDCLVVTGPVQQVGTRPVMVLTWAMKIQSCQ